MVFLLMMHLSILFSLKGFHMLRNDLIGLPTPEPIMMRIL